MLIFILVKEIMLYTGKSPFEAPLILWDTETVPLMISIRQEYRSLKMFDYFILSSTWDSTSSFT